MTETRRAALKKALAAAVAAATPASLLRAAGKVGTLKLPLQDGSELEFTERTIFHLKGPGPNEKTRSTRTAVVNGDFKLKGSGRILIEQGRIKQVLGNSSSEAFVREVCCMFAQMPADASGRISNPAASAKFWVLKNRAGDELEFKVR